MEIFQLLFYARKIFVNDLSFFLIEVSGLFLIKDLEVYLIFFKHFASSIRKLSANANLLV
ncbi:NADH-quinone oxidoreductase [Streptococcus cristatus]|nr:NADH-quinone oxidoreductase [Streptococcus cristatus]